MLVCTCRVKALAEDHPLRELLADLHREPDVLRLDLSGLDSADVSGAGAGVGDPRQLGTPGTDLARALESSTNGNPFFVTELVRSLAETGALVSEHGR